MATHGKNGAADDDARYRAAHKPAALWAAYLARRQHENPLYLRRTLSYVPGVSTQIGSGPAAAPAADRAAARYLRLRLPGTALRAAEPQRFEKQQLINQYREAGNCRFRR